MNRRQDKYVSFSLDDEQAQEVADSVSVEETVERKQEILLLRKAIKQLNVREQGIIIDYFFGNFSLRSLAEKYGVSHTKISSEVNEALAKLRQYITDKIE